MEQTTETAPPLQAYTVLEFCRAHRLSESLYYKLRKAGHGPRETKLNSKVTISVEDAATWRKERASAAA